MNFFMLVSLSGASYLSPTPRPHRVIASAAWQSHKIKLLLREQRGNLIIFFTMRLLRFARNDI